MQDSSLHPARLKDKVAFITGSGSGIGRAAAELFASHGAKVVIATRAAETGKETARRIESAGGICLFVETDVTSEQSVDAAVSAAVAEFGALHILYNNAGGSTRRDGRLTEAPLEEFWRALNLDLFGTWLCSRRVIPEIIRAGGGSVIHTTSIVALKGSPDRDAYTASKGAIVALTRSMAAEFAPHNVRVNAIAPSATLTERVKGILATRPASKALADKHLLGLAEPLDVAHAALFLASDEARMITGHILPVDSGVSAT